jgi:hypothetical protein
MENFASNFNTVTIILIIVGIVAGYLFGLVDSWVTGRIRKNKEDQPEPEVIIKDNPGVLRVTMQEGQPQVEVDGLSLRPQTMTPDQRARLVSILVQIRPWVDGKTASAQPAPAAAPRPATSPTASPAASPAPVSRPIGLSQPASPLLPKGQPDLPAASQPTTLIGMIDRVLQKNLLTSPYKGMEIKLEDGRLGEVIVVVGDKKYDGVDAVPDAGIQQVIRDAIAEFNTGQ